MSTSASRSNAPSGSSSTNVVANPSEKSPFEQQRDALVSEIAISLEHVLQNINKLNRSLEGVIAVGNEFGSVEALWSQFEGVMGDQPEEVGEQGEGEEEEGAEWHENVEGEGDTTMTRDE
ncbi:MAG: hypothetical protein M1833_000889 [Piccolia ochrophora]|nr:MAG: hypothetical protein M1833_000889 [Piccolia ochrophora]